MSSNKIFEDRAELVLENGYNVIPILPGSKRPYPHIKGWQSIEANKSTVKRWIAEGCGEGGIGITTKFTPAIRSEEHTSELQSH